MLDFKTIKAQFSGVKQFLKPFDYVMIVLSIVLSFTPHLVFAIQQAQIPEGSQIYAIIKMNGEEVDRFELTENGQHQEILYHPSESQYNLVEIEGTRIRVKEDNSPNQIAVMTGWIDQPGETAICLPHNFLIEIVGELPEDDLVLPF